MKWRGSSRPLTLKDDMLERPSFLHITSAAGIQRAYVTDTATLYASCWPYSLQHRLRSLDGTYKWMGQ
jgi:hypothetical protein